MDTGLWGQILKVFYFLNYKHSIFSEAWLVFCTFFITQSVITDGRLGKKISNFMSEEKLEWKLLIYGVKCKFNYVK
jgi:hypothetical protein